MYADVNEELSEGELLYGREGIRRGGCGGRGLAGPHRPHGVLSPTWRRSHFTPQSNIIGTVRSNVNNLNGQGE